MTEQTGWFEPATPAPAADSAGLPGTGPVAEDRQPAEPGTEAPGAAAAEPGPAEPEPETAEPEPETATPVPEPDADPQQVAEEAAAAEPEQLEAISSTSPAPTAPPFIPDVGVAPWLRDVLNWLHERLANLEG